MQVWVAGTCSQISRFLYGIKLLVPLNLSSTLGYLFICLFQCLRENGTLFIILKSSIRSQEACRRSGSNYLICLRAHSEVESVVILAGDWELIVKIRATDQDEYCQFLKNVISKEKGIEKTSSLISLKQVKTEFVQLQSDR